MQYSKYICVLQLEYYILEGKWSALRIVIKNWKLMKIIRNKKYCKKSSCCINFLYLKKLLSKEIPIEFRKFIVRYFPNEQLIVNSH